MSLLLKTSNRRRGFSLVEVTVSSVLLIILSIITVGGMIVHARMAQANITRHEMSEGSRRFMELANVEALDATIVRVDDGPAGEDTVLTLGRPDPANIGGSIFRQLVYLDTDGNPATLRDNRIVERTVTDLSNTGTATDGTVLVKYCRRVGNTPIFSLDPNAVKPLVNILFRVGDQTYPQSNADDAVTGKGYQSFLVSTSVSQL